MSRFSEKKGHQNNSVPEDRICHYTGKKFEKKTVRIEYMVTSSNKVFLAFEIISVRIISTRV